MVRSTPPRFRQEKSRYVATVDSRRARLLRLDPAPRGTERAEIVNEIEEVWIEKEYGRPVMVSRDGTRVSVRKDETDERRARFARRVARWLGGEMERAGTERVGVYCAPALYGSFLRAIPKRLADRIDLHRRNASKLTPARVAEETSEARTKSRRTGT